MPTTNNKLAECGGVDMNIPPRHSQCHISYPSPTKIASIWWWNVIWML